VNRGIARHRRIAPLEVRAGFNNRPDTPPSSNRHHPASAITHPNGLLDDLKKALADRALNAEMDHHLVAEAGAGNSRNGYGRKMVTTDSGKFELEVPRDRQSSFDPQLIAKYQRRFPGFDDKIISMYARGP
jgi:putative transposase